MVSLWTLPARLTWLAIPGSNNFPTTAGAFQTSLKGPANAFIVKLNRSGSGLVYSTYLGGSNRSRSGGSPSDSSGSAYVTGSTSSSDFPTTGGVPDHTGRQRKRLRRQAECYRFGACLLNLSLAAVQETVLIEGGVLRGYLSDKLSARLMGAVSTGSGRRENYQSIPMPRMTNTYMLAGDDAPEDILRSVKRGLYAVNFGGGQVDITNGKFVFSASEAYLIEDGKITAPVRDATLIGNGPEALKHVSMVGHDLKLDEGIGTCGKDGQSVPVGVGMPTIKLDKMTVGGTGR